MKALLVGDISPTVKSDPLFAKKDTDGLFSKELQNLFKESDFNFVNLEVALTDRTEGIKKFGPCLKGSGNAADLLKDMGVTVCGLSNNHIFDFGSLGVRDTLAHLDRVKMPYTGYGSDYEDSRKNFVFEKNGERLCIIAVCEHEYSYATEDFEGARPFDCFDTVEDIREAKKTADRVVVLYHGGKECCRYPSPRLVKVCRAMVRAGADLVLCQHTHIIGCYEKYEGAHILYGQGNFHFAGHADTDEKSWNQSLVTLYDTKTGEVEFVPITNEGVQMKLAEGEEKSVITGEFEKRNAMPLKAWFDEFSNAAHTDFAWYVKAVGYENASKEDFHLLAHYLDCEAHHDILNEHFKTAHQKKENY
jgi:poly-gamma-glutamate synthesis protein (capsule biosynthesis protein)